MQDIDRKVDKLLRSKRHSRMRKGFIMMGVLVISAMIVTAGVISYVMHSDRSFNISGKEKWIKVNGNDIPFDEDVTLDIDAGDSGTVEFNFTNSWNHDITVYCYIEGFASSGLTVTMDTIGTFDIPAGSYIHNDLHYSTDSWMLSENVSGIIYVNTTSG